jgi:hypothetical protein
MDKKHLLALLLLAGIEHKAVYEIANQYWPDVPDYYETRRSSPWWLIQTPAGLIEIGWRKRVISIDWSATAIRGLVTDDNVTKDETMVHAWGYDKAVEYLIHLAQSLRLEIMVSGKGE